MNNSMNDSIPGQREKLSQAASIPIRETKPSRTVSRHMGCHRRDFFRNLPTAMEGRSYRILDESLVMIREYGRQLEIRLQEGFQRSLSSSLQLPVTPIEFRFFGYCDAEVEAFLHAFDRHYQRGGG
uniref:Uncharacterized protein n=1 Tax=Candidatus Kentrum sp. LFY TaxID=2126342 RepID=A0A450WZ12_9GAMM|nr:MAG: hypothetical protein BECKLFY1418C_GA0070996_11145 [Candidatus Kentron sp. LFY]